MTRLREPLWWEDRVNVATLAHWLIEHDRLDLHDVANLIERPWNWGPEWREADYDLTYPEVVA